MADNELGYVSANKAIAAFAAKVFSPLELMQACIAQAQVVQSALNCFTETYFDKAMDLAKAAEHRLSRNQGRALEGIPFAVKDEFRLSGTRRTSASLVFKDRIDDQTDIYIQRLIDAGAIPLLKTTTPEFCLLGTTHSRLFGVTRNPWNLDFSPGGSSGGSAAALAAGVVPLATGSDIGGSIRIPASACGVVGYKPPYGRNPEIEIYNLDYYSHSGPLARSVADCALMQNVTSGQHVSDITSLRDSIRLNLEATVDLRSWKIAYCIDFGIYEIDDAVRINTEAALNTFRDLGATVVEVDLGWNKQMAFASEDHLHLSGIGLAQYVQNHREQLTDYVIDHAEASLKATVKDLLRADEAAVAMYRSFAPVLDKYNVFICPTLTVPAPPATHSQINSKLTVNGRETTMLPEEWEITRLFNMLSRCPVLSVPSGFAPNGVPTGIQIVGRPYWDETVFAAASAFERVQPWFADADCRPVIAV